MQPGAAPQQVVHQRRGLDQLLEVVQHQQQVLLLQVGAQLQVGRVGAAHLQAQGLGDGRGDQIGIADRRQAHEEGAVLEVLQHVLGHGQGQPGLADARRPEQGDQPCAVGEQSFAHGGDVVFAADERGELGGEVVGTLWTEQARLCREVVACAARQRHEVGQIGIGAPTALARDAASGAEGCRSPASILRSVTSAQPARCASSFWVSPSALRRCLSHWPKLLLSVIYTFPARCFLPTSASDIPARTRLGPCQARNGCAYCITLLSVFISQIASKQRTNLV